MKVISVFNQKGGVGKTTSNVNLCSYLCMEGYKVLAIDIDPQGNTTSGLGIDKSSLSISMYDLLTSDIDIRQTIINCDLLNNLYLIPSNLDLAGAEVEIINFKNRESILKSKMEKIKDEFDFIFIDCPPSLGFLTLNALVASNSVLVPMQCEYYALEGLGQLINTVQLVKKSLNQDLELEGVIVNMFDGRTKLSCEVLSEIKRYFKDKVFKTTIPRNIKLAEAPSFGLPIVLYDGKCKGAEAYKNLTKEFLRRIKDIEYE